MNSEIYPTTEEWAQRIKYDCRTIRDRLKDSVLIEGKHYSRPFGGRKILYIWSAIERDMKAGRTPQCEQVQAAGIPMASGGFCNVKYSSAGGYRFVCLRLPAERDALS